MATFAEELDEDLIREARANSQHLLGTPMAHAFKNYGADRAKQAKDAALQAQLADALKTGVKLDEARLNPNAARDYDARVAADVARAAAAAHGTVSDDDDDDDGGEKPAEAEATRADCLKAAECLHRCELLKQEGNAAFRAACAEQDEHKAREVAFDAAIYYLDVLDAIYVAEQRPMAPDQQEAMRALKLATLLNRGAALNKQLDWKLSLKACNQALLLDKDNVKGLYRRAVALAGLGQGAEAEGDLLRVLELAPQNKDAQRRLRELKKAMKRKPKPKKAPPSSAEAEDGFTPLSQSPEEAAELKRMEADYHAANAAIARARKAHPPPPPPPAPAPTEADLAFAEAVAAAERLPKPPFDPYDVVGLDGDGHSTGADFERAFEEDMRKRAAAASEEE